MNSCISSDDQSPVQPPPVASFVSSSDPFYQKTLQQRLQVLIEGAPESWTYGIIWQPSGSSSTILGWGDGYYQGDHEHTGTHTTSSNYSPAFMAHQQTRKRVLRELNSLILGLPGQPDHHLDDDFVEDVTDTEWFFLISMTQSFENGSGLPGRSLSRSSPIWIAGGEKLRDSACERARQARGFGLQTMVFVPSTSGVVELGSTALIYQRDDLMEEVEALFNFDNGDLDFESESGINVGLRVLARSARQ